MQRKRKFSISALMLSTAESADNIGKCEPLQVYLNLNVFRSTLAAPKLSLLESHSFFVKEPETTNLIFWNKLS